MEADVQVKGVVLDLLTWLCKAVRIPTSVNPLKLSSSGCEIFRVPSARQSATSRDVAEGNPKTRPLVIMRFRLYRKPVSLPIGRGCWVPLLSNCTIAEITHPDTIPDPGFHGLKLSFELMIRMAAVEYPVRVNDDNNSLWVRDCAHSHPSRRIFCAISPRFQPFGSDQSLQAH
jgi:hypothetical protein